MRVYDLIEQLKQLPANRQVYLARDSEGNGFNMASVAQIDKMDGDCEVYHPDDYDDHPDLKEVVVIWP